MAIASLLRSDRSVQAGDVKVVGVIRVEQDRPYFVYLWVRHVRKLGDGLKLRRGLVSESELAWALRSIASDIMLSWSRF